MKSRTIFLVMVMLAFCRPADATYCIDQSKFLRSANQRELSQVATRGPCIYATPDECRNAIKEYARQMGSSSFASMAECVDCSGSGVSSGGTSDQQMVQGLADALFGFLLSPKPDTSYQDEIERKNAIKLQQEKEQKKQADMKAANQAWIDLQNIEQEKRNFDDAKKLEAGNDLLAKIGTVGGDEPKLETVGTDFFGADQSSEARLQPEGKSKDPALELSDEFKEITGKLIQQRLQEENKRASAVSASLKIKVPPLPFKKFGELQVGDVLLIAPDDRKGYFIRGGDNVLSGGKVTDVVLFKKRISQASHTIIYVREINGKKFFLDNQSKEGPRIVSEDTVRQRYGSRGAEVARLVGEPLSEKQAATLYQEAKKMAAKNVEKTKEGNRYDTSNYGVWGDNDVVCSEADWALINATGRNIPESGEQLKAKLDVHWSPANYSKSEYFLVTPFAW